MIEQLLSYLEKPAPLHSVRSNLVCRAIGYVLDKRSNETLVTMQAKPNLMDRFLEHLDNASVVELLQKIVSTEPSSEGAEEAHFKWLNESQLISKLTCKLDPKLDADTHMNAAGALVDMLRVPAMAKSLETEEILNSLLTFVLANESPKPLAPNSAMISGLNVVIELLRHSPAIKFESSTDLPMDKLPLTYSVILKSLERFKKILSINEANEKITTTMGDIEPLGFARLKVLELVSVLSQSNYQCVDNVLMEKDIFTLVLDLFFYFRWNNVLHAHVLNMLRRGLEGANEDIKEHLLKHVQLPKRIVEAERENEAALADGRGVRRGYMGHLVQLATELKKQASHSKVIEQILESDEEWKNFRDGFLKQRNELEAHLLGGRVTQMDSGSSAEEEDDEDDQDDDDDDDIERQFMEDANIDDADFNHDGPFEEQPHGSASSSDDEDDEDDEDDDHPPQSPESS